MSLITMGWCGCLWAVSVPITLTGAALLCWCCGTVPGGTRIPLSILPRDTSSIPLGCG